MAKQTLNFSSKSYKQVVGCQEVLVCLATDADSASGNGLVVGTVENTGRFLTDTPGYPVQNPRGQELYQYSITIDDTELAEDVVLTCADILDFSTDVCILNKLIAALG